jgi:hypothetical protein
MKRTWERLIIWLAARLILTGFWMCDVVRPGYEYENITLKFRKREETHVS